MNLSEVSEKDEPASLADIARALKSAHADRIAAESEMLGLAERRSEALVSGTDAAVDQIEAEQAACARRLDRLDATIARLTGPTGAAMPMPRVH